MNSCEAIDARNHVFDAFLYRLHRIEANFTYLCSRVYFHHGMIQEVCLMQDVFIYDFDGSP